MENFMNTLKLANLFTNNAILQRDRPVPIWGWSTPGETVTVKFARQKKTAVAGADGKWLVYLDALPASTKSRELSVVSGPQAPVTVQNVLVGDVWLCSGQSNMQWAVTNSNQAEKEIAAAKHPRLRLFTVPNKALLWNRKRMWTQPGRSARQRQSPRSQPSAISLAANC